MSEAVSWRWCAWEELGQDALHEVLAVRQAVFVVEQACPYPDIDGRDPLAYHLLGSGADALCAYLRAFGPGIERAEAVIGRVVVADAARGTGLGAALMREGLAAVERTWPGAPVWVSAQAHLRAWYERLGFAVCGAGYDEDGIPHLPMRRG